MVAVSSPYWLSSTGTSPVSPAVSGNIFTWIPAQLCLCFSPIATPSGPGVLTGVISSIPLMALVFTLWFHSVPAFTFRHRSPWAETTSLLSGCVLSAQSGPHPGAAHWRPGQYPFSPSQNTLDPGSVASFSQPYSLLQLIFLSLLLNSEYENHTW